MTTQPNPSKPNRQETPCPICGSQNFVWGRTVGESPQQWIYFRADGGIWGDGKQLLARQCADCFNVQLFASVE
ncbi:MAG TPA: hypothetical protein IGS40_15350 [Trichormus sp. M33_DOE_039]|nr:hypothetical protein [Trichormus sp. M33_DOE_039]